MKPSRRQPPTHSRKKPAPPVAPKPNRLVLEKQARQRAFCEAFEAIGTVSGAAEHVGISRQQHYDWLKQDADYAAAVAEAEEKSIDRLEQECRRRGLVGYDEAVYYKGKVVGRVRKHSDTLLMFLLNGRRPEIFKHRQEVTGKNGGPIQTQSVPADLSKLSGDQLEAYIKLQALVEGREVTA